jgi:hypothetical protein
MEIDNSNSNNNILPLDPKQKHTICESALSRWLDAEEIQKVLKYYDELGFLISNEKPFCPSSGNIYLYDRNKTKDFRQDGVEWALKKRINRIQETYQKIKIKGVTVIIGFYARMASNQLFQRRIYRLIPEKDEIILIHYRLCKPDERHISYYPPQNNILQQSQYQQMNNSNSLNVNNVLPYNSNINDNRIENDMLMDLISWPVESNTLPNQPLLQLYQTDIYLSNITDFSPSRDVCDGGVKVLICLGIDLPTYFSGPNSLALYVSFGEVKVRAEILSLSVIRCRSPCMKAGWSTINIQTLDGVIICPSSDQQFEHYDNNNVIGHMNNNLIKNELISNNNSDDLIERDHKIRIIEKLTTVTNSINPSKGVQSNRLEVNLINNDYNISNFGSNLGPGLGVAQGLFGDNLEWIDDHELALLPAKELEKQMDLYLLSIVNQLVQVASLEDDLKSELEAWDSNGFSILHYCCLYNAYSLIPVLLSKGIDINLKTRYGSSPLHIAAGGGYLDITTELIDNNANHLATDSYDLTPYDKAFQSSHYEVADYLSNLNNSTSNSNINNNQSSIISTDLNLTTNISTNPNENNQPQLLPFSFNNNGDNNRTSESLSQSPSLDDLNKLLLNNAFTSLSLADKCAFSLSLTPGERDSDMNSSIRSDSIIDDSIDFEMQSVLSEIDKGSLDVAMSLMGINELNELEMEASRIQNNVRGWLLRKNYINLRHAATLLQSSWREKRHLFAGNNNKDNDVEINDHLDNKDRTKHTRDGDEFHFQIDSNNLREKEAAAKLQSFTRKILEKKKFSEIRKQAIASLVIQNSLAKWWKNQTIK